MQNKLIFLKSRNFKLVLEFIIYSSLFFLLILPNRQSYNWNETFLKKKEREGHLFNFRSFILERAISECEKKRLHATSSSSGSDTRGREVRDDVYAGGAVLGGRRNGCVRKKRRRRQSSSRPPTSPSPPPRLPPRRGRRRRPRRPLTHSPITVIYMYTHRRVWTATGAYRAYRDAGGSPGRIRSAIFSLTTVDATRRDATRRRRRRGWWWECFVPLARSIYLSRRREGKFNSLAR